MLTENDKCVIPELNNWVDYFNDLTIYRVNLLTEKINNARRYQIIYPDTNLVFRVFKDSLPENVKVIILGQDPYYDGNANGYAFGCRNYVSPSLSQMWKSMENLPSTLPKHKVNMNLEYLVEQGVFLLNTVLTVKSSEPNSHKNVGWKTFTREFIINFSSTNKNVVYMLWGSAAKQYKRFINPENNLILEDTHPVYASRNNKEWNCNHFELANNYLIKNNKNPINWK